MLPKPSCCLSHAAPKLWSGHHKLAHLHSEHPPFKPESCQSHVTPPPPCLTECSDHTLAPYSGLALCTSFAQTPPRHSMGLDFPRQSSWSPTGRLPFSQHGPFHLRFLTLSSKHPQNPTAARHLRRLRSGPGCFPCCGTVMFCQVAFR